MLEGLAEGLDAHVELLGVRVNALARRVHGAGGRYDVSGTRRFPFAGAPA